MLNDIPPSTKDIFSAGVEDTNVCSIHEAGDAPPLARRIDVGQKIGELTEIKSTGQILEHLAGILRTMNDGKLELNIETLDQGAQRIAATHSGVVLTDAWRRSASEGFETRVTVGTTTLVVVSPCKLSAQCEHDTRTLTRVAALQIEMNARKPWHLDEPSQHAAGDYADSTPGVVRKQYQRQIEREIERLAASPFNILITGETGTGKTRSAKEIHAQSARAAKQFVAFNCAAIPEHLAESELFGYKKGAFTGAVCDHSGLFEAAIGGTLFIDEVGDLSLPIQSKLLTAIEERKIRRLGENFDRACDVRIIAGTSCNLPEMIRAGRFRADMYYRLATLNMHTLPLRERKIEIPGLIDLFLTEAAAAKQALTNETTEFKIESRGVELLCSYEWRGNIRELRNAVFELTSYVTTDHPIMSEAVRAHLNCLTVRHAVSDTIVAPAAVQFSTGEVEESVDMLLSSGGAITVAATKKLLADFGIEIAENDVVVPLDACVVRSGETLSQWEARTVVSCIDATREKLGKWHAVAKRLGMVDSTIRQRRRYAANKLKNQFLKAVNG